MASWKTKLESGDLPTDLAGLGNMLADPFVPVSTLFTAIKAGMVAYNSAELTPEEKEKESQLKTKLGELADYDESQAWAVYVEAVQKVKPGKDAKTQYAKLEQTREKAIADGKAKLAESRAKINADLGKLANKRVVAFWEAFYTALGTGTGTGTGTGKTHAKLAESQWYIGPHREKTGSLLSSSPNTGQFAYNGATRELWFYPTGSAYNAALVAARPMGLTAKAWVKLGNVIDASATRSLTGLQRYCYDVISHAGQYDNTEACILATNEVARLDNLAGNNTMHEPKGNAGGTVFCTPLDAKAVGFPGFTS